MTIYFYQNKFLYMYFSKTMQTFYDLLFITQPAITCSKLTIETLEQGVKYVQS